MPSQYPWVWTGYLFQGAGSHWRSVSFYQWEAGAQVIGIGFERGSEWEELGQEYSCDFQEGEVESTVCIVSSGLGCFYEEPGCDGVLNE